MTWCNIKQNCLVFSCDPSLWVMQYFSIFFMKDNVHPSPSFNCCSWGSLSGLESLWIWHRKRRIIKGTFSTTPSPSLLLYAILQSFVQNEVVFDPYRVDIATTQKAWRRKRLYCSINRFSMANIKWMLWPQLDPTSIFCNINHSKPQKSGYEFSNFISFSIAQSWL